MPETGRTNFVDSKKTFLSSYCGDLNQLVSLMTVSIIDWFVIPGLISHYQQASDRSYNEVEYRGDEARNFPPLDQMPWWRFHASVGIDDLEEVWPISRRARLGMARVGRSNSDDTFWSDLTHGDCSGLATVPEASVSNRYRIVLVNCMNRHRIDLISILSESYDKYFT